MCPSVQQVLSYKFNTYISKLHFINVYTPSGQTYFDVSTCPTGVSYNFNTYISKLLLINVCTPFVHLRCQVSCFQPIINFVQAHPFGTTPLAIPAIPTPPIVPTWAVSAMGVISVGF